MGYFVNRFDRLMELKKDQSINEQFKLTAIIVHDPKDHNLTNFLKKHFISFAESTGKKFLIITFVRPSREDVETLISGENKYAKLLIDDINHFSSRDTRINSLVRKYYSLPDDGSYMVISKNLSDNVFRVTTTWQSINNQLMYLTEYCRRPTNFNELIAQLEGESINIEEMLVDSLLNIFSLTSPTSSSEFPDDQREIAKQTINEEKQKLLTAMKLSSNDEDLTEKVLKVYDIIEYAYDNVFYQGQHSPKVQTHIYYDLLDGQSKAFWNTYSRLSQFLICESQPDELDYSAFILYLAKIVETELNLSICQMLRESMGIAMPRYYNKYCQEAGSVCIPTAHQNVRLNRYGYQPESRRRVLKGVALGDLLYAYKTAMRIENTSDFNWHVLNPEYLVKMPNEFLKLWNDFTNVRNGAAHARLVNIESFNDTKFFFKVFQERYLLRLYQIKETLRYGRQNITTPNPYDLGW